MDRVICMAASLLLLIPSVSTAQNRIPDPGAMGRHAEAHPYLNSSNAAFLDLFGTGHLAQIEAEAVKENGGFIPLEGSPDSFNAGVNAASFTRLSDRIVLHGKLGYDYFRGRDMNGQIMLNPKENPVNFLEEATENPGVKLKEMYSVLGGISYRFTDRWAVGLNIDYTAGDMSKHKDPRFRNELMDLDISAGTTLKAGESNILGLNLNFRRKVEQVKGNLFGTTDKTYMIFTDKGNFWGSSEGLDGEYAYVPTSNFRPMVNSWYGGGLQFNHSGKVDFFSDLSACWRSGYYGDHSSSKPVFFEFSGIEVDWKNSSIMKKDDVLHIWRIDASFKTLGNEENSFKYVTPQGGNTVVEYIGSNKILNRIEADADFGYTFRKGNTGEGIPAFEAGMDASGYWRSQKSTLFPFYRKSMLTNFSVAVFGAYNKNFGKTILGIRAQAGAGTGFGTAAEEGELTSGATSSIKKMDDYLYAQFEYDSAMRAFAGMEARLTRRFGKILAWVAASDALTTMTAHPDFLSSPLRNSTTIRVGCNF